MSTTDEFLEKIGFSHPDIKDYDDLSATEQETYKEWLDTVQRSAITLDDVRKHIHKMRQAIEYELAGYDKDNRKDLHLKARLKNYLLLEALFERPERAKEMIEDMSKGFKA